MSREIFEQYKEELESFIVERQQNPKTILKEPMALIFSFFKLKNFDRKEIIDFSYWIRTNEPNFIIQYADLSTFEARKYYNYPF